VLSTEWNVQLYSNEKCGENFSGGGRDVVSGTTVRAIVLGRFGRKNEKYRFERYGQKRIKILKNYKGDDALGH